MEKKTVRNSTFDQYHSMSQESSQTDPYLGVVCPIEFHNYDKQLFAPTTSVQSRPKLVFYAVRRYMLISAIPDGYDCG